MWTFWCLRNTAWIWLSTTVLSFKKKSWKVNYYSLESMSSHINLLVPTTLALKKYSSVKKDMCTLLLKRNQLTFIKLGEAAHQLERKKKLCPFWICGKGGYLNYIVLLRIIMDLSEKGWCYLKAASFSMYVVSCYPILFKFVVTLVRTGDMPKWLKTDSEKYF